MSNLVLKIVAAVALTMFFGAFITIILMSSAARSPGVYSLETLDTSTIPAAAFPHPNAIIAKAVTPLSVSDVASKAAFESTLRSCLAAKCFDQPMNGVERVGVLGLPGSGSITLHRLLSDLSPSLRGGLNSALEVTIDTHVPAYGYGKNHGWTRIVRFVGDIATQAYLMVNYDGSEKSLQSYEAQVRQLARWHCRLSHVAAHTKMLTVFAEELIMRPAFELDRIISFIGTDISRDALLLKLGAMTRSGTPNRVKDMIESETRNVNNKHSKHPDISADIRSFGYRILQDELDISHGLTDWPCKSFQPSNDKQSGIPHAQYLPLAASDVAANCSSPYVKCSVPVDRKGG